jgi:hypothetical protein
VIDNSERLQLVPVESAVGMVVVGVYGERKAGPSFDIFKKWLTGTCNSGLGGRNGVVGSRLALCYVNASLR